MVLYSSEILQAVSNHDAKLTAERKTEADRIRSIANPIKDNSLHDQFGSMVSFAKIAVAKMRGNEAVADEVNIRQVFYQAVRGMDAYESIGVKEGLLINYGLEENDINDPVLYVPEQEGGFKAQYLKVELDRGEAITPNRSTFRINVPILSPQEQEPKYITAPVFQVNDGSFVDLKVYKGESDILSDGGKIDVTLAEVTNVSIVKEADQLIKLINASAENVAQGLHMSQSEHAFEEKVKAIAEKLQTQNKRLENTDSQTKELANFIGKAVILAKGILEKEAKG